MRKAVDRAIELRAHHYAMELLLNRMVIRRQIWIFELQESNSFLFGQTR